MTANFLKSYHNAVSCTLLKNYKYDLEHLAEVKRLFDLLYGVYSERCLNINLYLNKRNHNER